MSKIKKVGILVTLKKQNKNEVCCVMVLCCCVVALKNIKKNKNVVV